MAQSERTKQVERNEQNDRTEHATGNERNDRTEYATGNERNDRTEQHVTGSERNIRTEETDGNGGNDQKARSRRSDDRNEQRDTAEATLDCDHHFLDEVTVQDVARTFKTLGDPTRIKILYLLSQEECSVGHIAEALHMSQSAVSHQLALLRNLRLVKHRREGQNLYYSSDDDHVIRLLQQAIDHATHG